LHKCLECQEPDETQEHILKCTSAGARKQRYELVDPMMKKIRQNNLCHAQEVLSLRCFVSGPGLNLQKQSYWL
jgi:hypothetical protein